MQLLMTGKDFFKAQQRYIRKQIKVQRKLNFAILCLHVKESSKACEESGKACEKSCKECKESPMWKYLKASLSEKDFRKIFLENTYALLKKVY